MAVKKTKQTFAKREREQQVRDKRARKRLKKQLKNQQPAAPADEVVAGHDEEPAPG